MTLSATDDGRLRGGVIRYTTDGSDPSRSNGAVYSSILHLGDDHRQVPGHRQRRERRGRQQPADPDRHRSRTRRRRPARSSATARPAASFYTGSVSVSLAATDNGGSGVSHRLHDRRLRPLATNGTAYAAAFSISSTTTVKYRAYDDAGNAEPVNSALIRVDTTAPTSTISCNGGPAPAGSTERSR